MLSVLPWRRVLRRELLLLYLVIFLADTVVGFIMPLFPLLARDLGASLMLIGSLVAFKGITQVAVAVPIGLLSDRFGRQRLIAAGALCFAATAASLALVSAPMLLVVAQILLGIGIVAVFGMGAAMVGDYSAPSERGLVMGCLTTAMGLGFATGPLLGGALAELTGVRSSLLAFTFLSVATFALAWLGLTDVGTGYRVRAANPLHHLRLLAANRALMLAAVANLLLSPVFNGVIVNFMPLKAQELGLSTMAIGALFTLRALVSTGTRLPAGFISTPRWSHRIMLAALLLAGGAVLVLAQRSGYTAFSLALVAEGISFGIFLTAGQAFVTQYAEAEVRGAALGAYNMAGGIGTALSPFILGVLAESFGLDTIFFLVGVVTLGGALALAVAFQGAIKHARPAG